MLVSSDGEIEGLDLSIEPPERSDGPLTISFRIDHFSVVVISSLSTMGHELTILEPLPESEYTVGESFTVRMRIERSPWESEGPNLRRSRERGAPWRVRDQWIVSPINGPLEPGDPDSASNTSFLDGNSIFGPDGTLGSQLDTQEMADGQPSWTKSHAFVCDRPGSYEAAFTAIVLESIRWTYIEPPRSAVVPYNLRLTARFSGECTLPPIVAVLSAPVTTYTIDLPAGDFTFGWSGADCGTASGTDTNTYVWSHDDEDCEHAGEAHDGTPISLLIVTDKFEARCSYVSAASGTGPKCERTQ